MITMTKRFEFCYGHQLPNHKGKCKRMHGHNAVLEVEIAGPIDKETGMIADFGELKKHIDIRIIDTLDHHWLNDRLRLKNPTAENIVKWIADEIIDDVLWSINDVMGPGKTITLERVRLYETPDSWVEWRQDESE